MHRLIYVSFILFFAQQILFANTPLVQFGVGVVIFIFCIIQGVSILKKLKDMELDIWGCLSKEAKNTPTSRSRQTSKWWGELAPFFLC